MQYFASFLVHQRRLLFWQMLLSDNLIFAIRYLVCDLVSLCGCAWPVVIRHYMYVR